MIVVKYAVTVSHVSSRDCSPRSPWEARPSLSKPIYYGRHLSPRPLHLLSVHERIAQYTMVYSSPVKAGKTLTQPTKCSDNSWSLKGQLGQRLPLGSDIPLCPVFSRPVHLPTPSILKGKRRYSAVLGDGRLRFAYAACLAGGCITRRPSASAVARPVSNRHRSTASRLATATIAFFRAGRFLLAITCCHRCTGG